MPCCILAAFVVGMVARRWKTIRRPHASMSDQAGFAAQASWPGPEASDLDWTLEDGDPAAPPPWWAASAAR